MKPVKRCPLMYESNKEMIDEHVDHVLPPLLQKMEWKEGELILDHGCASGSTGFKYLTPYIERSNSTLYGFDICKSLVGYAAENFAHPNIKYVSGNLQDDPSPLAGLKFNKIFSLYTLHFIENYGAELKALYDLLAPGGELFLMIVVDCHLFDLYADMKEHDKWNSLAAYHLVLPPWRKATDNYEQFFREKFEQIGYEVKEANFLERTYLYEHPGIFADMIFGLNGAQLHLKPNDKEELRVKYNKFFAETPTKYYDPEEAAASGNTEYNFHYDRLDVLAKKPAE